MPCRGICVRYQGKKKGAEGHYKVGHKRCQICQIFLDWTGLHCPCCNYRLRTRPRNKKYKEEFRAIRAMKAKKLIEPMAVVV